MNHKRQHPQEAAQKRSSEIKYMDIEKFQRLGYLQEVNRLFFHPLGLALEIGVYTDTDDATDTLRGDVRFTGIQDNRDDPEGIRFANGMIDEWKVANIRGLLAERARVRMRKFGWVIQPPGHPNLISKAFQAIVRLQSRIM